MTSYEAYLHTYRHTYMKSITALKLKAVRWLLIIMSINARALGGKCLIVMTSLEVRYCKHTHTFDLPGVQHNHSTCTSFLLTFLYDINHLGTVQYRSWYFTVTIMGTNYFKKSKNSCVRGWKMYTTMLVTMVNTDRYLLLLLIFPQIILYPEHIVYTFCVMLVCA